MAERDFKAMTEHSSGYLTTGGTHPFYPYLVQAIEQADEIFMAVAFVRYSGLSLIFDALRDAVQRGKYVRVLTGDYLGITEPRALRLLLQLLQEEPEHTANRCELKVFESGQLSFHPKVYIFATMINAVSSTVENGFAYVGSSNLSKSALQQGIEWNVRVDMHENPARFIQLTTAYNELFESENTQKLTVEWIDTYQKQRFVERTVGRSTAVQNTENSIELVPRCHQRAALDALQEARAEGYKRGLVVMATGLGKTYLSAFDSLSVTSKDAPRILFVAHRQEILQQAESAYLDVYPDASTGYYMAARKDTQAEILFASIATLGQKEQLKQFAPQHFDYIVIDEFHHAAAKSYQHLLNCFEPQFLLGLTATPHRTDGADILALCDGNKIFEMNLLDGIELQKLAPFKYYGIQDEYVDYQRVQWRQGQFSIQDLEQAVNTAERAESIFAHWQEKSLKRTLAFCVSKIHAEYMAAFFTRKGVSCAVIHSTSLVKRHEGIDGLNSGRFQVLFTVDLFNEGVDIPLVDTVLMLRPTESRILFLQQLGRGLRKSDALPHKQLQVLDFIGNHHVFLNRPQMLLGVEPTVQSVREFVSRYRTNRLKLPAQCELDYDLAVIDWIAQWAESTASEKIQRTYDRLKQTLGSPPNALEMHQAGQGLDKVRKEYGSWFAFVDLNKDLSDAEQACLKQFYGFFKKLETTGMTKSYKMVTLQALIELNGFNTPQTIADIAAQSFAIIARRERLRGDLMEVKAIEGIAQYARFQDVPSPLQKQWIAYWKKNPVSAWCGQWSTQEAPKFETINDTLVFLERVPEAQVDAFYGMLQSLIDYHLFRYQPRLPV